MIPFPQKTYSIIYTDPPWFYEQKMQGSKATDHYPTMKTEDICKLLVQDISNNDCLLFMWASSPLVPDAMQVGKAWGFQYTTIGFIWDKRELVPGHYTMSQCELCLIFKKGKIPQPRGIRNARQFLSVRRSKHSAKPPEIRDRIKAMFPEQNRIELFARKPENVLFEADFDGWDVWGLEA